MPISDHGPLYVIVHRRVRGEHREDQVHDVRPVDYLAEIRERAADLEHNARTNYGRTEDTYRVAELRFADPTS